MGQQQGQQPHLRNREPGRLVQGDGVALEGRPIPQGEAEARQMGQQKQHQQQPGGGDAQAGSHANKTHYRETARAPHCHGKLISLHWKPLSRARRTILFSAFLTLLNDRLGRP